MGERHVATGFVGEIGVAAGGVGFRAVLRAQHEQSPCARFQHAAPGALDDFERIAIGNRDHRDETRRMLRDVIGVEFDQHLTGAHGCALLDLRREALAAQPDRVDADMQQNLGALRRAQRHRVMRAGEMRDRAVAGRDQHAVERIDADAVAEHAFGEDGIGHAGERHHGAGERCEQHEIARVIGGMIQL